MADLIPAELKTQAAQAMKDIFDTFKRSSQLTAYKSVGQVVVIKDPDFIPGFNESNQVTTEITKSAQSQSFDARIWYLDLQPLKGFVQGDTNIQTKFQHTWGRVKLQVELDGYNFLKDAERIWIYDEEHRIDEDFRRIGILNDIQFYQCILEKVN